MMFHDMQYVLLGGVKYVSLMNGLAGLYGRTAMRPYIRFMNLR
jgi:hypothetical protein